MKPARHEELNRPSSLEAILRADSYDKKYRIRMSEVSLEPVAGQEGVRREWYDFGSKVVAWGLTEILPGCLGPMRRQLCESTMFVLEEKGHTLVNGRKFEWERDDVLSLPLFARYQHVCAGQDAV